MQLSNAIHPYLTWCFKGETKMKAVQRLWKSCQQALGSGTGSSTQEPPFAIF